MKRIAVVSSSVRTGRLSHRVALFAANYFEKNFSADVDLLDLKQFDFPLFQERFDFQDNPSGPLQDFTRRFLQADGIFVVSPVYNASFPASLKNVIDLYNLQWASKVMGIASASFGKHGRNIDRGTARGIVPQVGRRGQSGFLYGRAHR